MPQTRYVGPVAYQVVGNGPPTLVINWGWVSNVEAFHAIPGYTHFIDALAEFARVVTLDPRGMGASDRSRLGSFDERVDDLASVVDAVSTEPVVLLGASSGGALAVAFAARRPERTQGLVLYGAYPRLLSSDELIFMASPELFAALRRGLERWGRGQTAGAVAPSVAVTPDGRDLWRRIESACIDNSRAVELLDIDATIDVVDLLSHVRCPTLVVHRVNEQFVPPQAARFLASRIPGAELVLLDGLDHYPWLANSGAVVAAIRAFLAGAAPPPPTMKAVLLTDIVRSTQQLIGAGDVRWNEILDAHDVIAASTVGGSGGRLIKSTGDGVVAVFDHPADALHCAVKLRDALSEHDLVIRIGVTVGDIVFRANDVTGLCVHIAHRIAGLAEPGQILVSRGVTVILAESRFEWLGTRAFRGVPGDRSVFELR